MTHFDHIIMNPPYSGNLHLKILREAMQHSDDIVNLSPIRWLEDPLAEYKQGSDWERFSDIRERIEELDKVDQAQASVMFGCCLTFGMGVYHLTKSGGANITIKNSIVDKVVKKRTDYNVTTVKDVKLPYFVLIVTIDGGHMERPNSMGSLCNFVRNEKWYGHFYETSTMKSDNGYTLEENKKRNIMSTNGNIEKWPCIEFRTKEEAENFYKSTKTKFFKYVYKVEMVDVNVHPSFLPFMPTYTHPWTDADLYAYFGLTPDEIDIIEKEMAKYTC